MHSFFGATAVCAAALVVAAPVWAGKSASDGVYGGYVGSSRQMEREMESARQRENIQRLGQSKPAAATGIEVQVHVAFPPNARGIANITTIELVPEGGSAHSAMTLPHFDRADNAIDATFVPSKDVQAGAYRVMLGDSRGGKLAAGRISVAAGKPAHFNLQVASLESTVAQKSSAHTSTRSPAPGSHYEPPQAGPGYVPPAKGAAYQAQQVGPGFVSPKVGPGYVPPKN